MKKVIIILVGIVVVAGALRLSLRIEAVQNFALDRVAGLFAAQANPSEAETVDGLRIVVCGSASPLGMSDQAQACIAVLTPEHFYLIDSGAGSARNVAAFGLPMNRLKGVFLTHFHSDHIAELYELNLGSWVRGRPEPMQVLGPDGVDEIANSINATYRQDRQYRIAHHGTDLLRPDLGLLAPVMIAEGVTFTDGDLSITSYRGSHDPVEPAVGYRVDYKGRSVVVSGDSNVNEETARVSDDADLLLHDALSVPIVTTLAAAAKEAGATRISKIMTDVLDYHASAESLVELGATSGVGMIAYYHLVPTPANTVMEEIFRRDFTDKFVLSVDGMQFLLPVGSDNIVVIEP